MKTPAQLAKKANKLRVEILDMVFGAKSGHTGGSLSVIDVLTALYFGGYLKNNPKKPEDPKRDYCILSKAHASPAMYAVLGERGFFDTAHWDSFRQVSSLLQGHVNQHVPGVEAAGGSLGQGLSIATGIALSHQLDKKKNNVFCVLGDGELQEGQVWEAAMTAAHYGLGNLTAIVDNNGLQIDGANDDVMNVAPITDKFAAFGWEVMSIDGHNMTQICQALETAAEPRDKPLVIVARTVKGKGAPAAEGNYMYHGKALSADEMAEAKDHLAAYC